MGRIVIDHEELADLLNRHRGRGHRIVLANGCFDLLHVGHTRFLIDAKHAGEVLVVAVNSDDSVRRIKGPGRPVTPQAERMEIIAALGAVDYVTCFDEPTVDRLILRLKPDFQAKGTEYAVDAVPEKKTVESYGGRVIICGDPKSHSTTQTIGRLGAEE